ncbi:diguanylate cyclase [Enterococcus sp. LJL128]|uniref:diguanylate cyclase n=1 Tax=Enterococcus sp. LJL51 TaxID=3416656 RepID=UPI003CEDC378
MNKSNKQGILMDASLLGFVTVVLLTAIFMAVGPNNFFFNLICLMISLILVIITYFTNIITGLIFNLLFFFGQLVYVFYVSMYKDGFTLGFIYWLIVPPILCLLVYGVTIRIREQVAENVQLRRNNARLNALDQETNLRTLNMFDEDFCVLSKASKNAPAMLSLMVIRIRYWDSMKSMITNDQIKEMIGLISDEIKQNFGRENFKYIIDHSVPTWGILNFEEAAQLKTIRLLIKEGFQKKMKTTEVLTDIHAELIISIVSYEEGEMKTSTDLLSAAIKELQYDV